MKVYAKESTLRDVFVLEAPSLRVEIDGYVIDISGTEHSQHGLLAFNIRSLEGHLNVIPIASNAIVVCPERKGGLHVKS